MKMRLILSPVLTLLTLGTWLAAAPVDSKVTVVESVPGLAAKAKFPADKAIAKIETLYPHCQILSAMLEQEGKTILYAFDITLPGKKGVEDIDISASTGKVIHKEHLSQAQYAKEKLADDKRAAAQRSKAVK